MKPTKAWALVFIPTDTIDCFLPENGMWIFETRKHAMGWIFTNHQCDFRKHKVVRVEVREVEKPKKGKRT